MKHRTLITCVLIAAIGTAGLSQTTLQEGRLELQGTVTYLYSSITEPYDSNLGFKPEISLQSFAISPSVGYSVSTQFQVSVQPRFVFTRSSSKQRADFMSSSGERHMVVTDYSPGIAIGVAYHIVGPSMMIPFIGVSTEISWSKRSIQLGLSGFPDPDPTWTSPEVVVPNIAIGVKTFFLQDWSLITQLQISSIQRPNGVVNAEGLRVSFGFGIAAYL